MDLDKIRKGNPDLKSEQQRNVIQNVEKFFDLSEKIIDFVRYSSFLLSEGNTEGNMNQKRNQNINP